MDISFELKVSVDVNTITVRMVYTSIVLRYENLSKKLCNESRPSVRRATVNLWLTLWCRRSDSVTPCFRSAMNEVTLPSFNKLSRSFWKHPLYKHLRC